MTATPTAERRIEYLPLDRLQAHPDNPKAHATEVLDGSLGRFGFVETIVLDGRTDQIISGHGRTETLRGMRQRGEPPPDGVRVEDDGTWLVPVTVGWSSRNDDEARAALVALNRAGEVGGWDDPALVAILGDLAAIDGGLDGVGFGVDDLDLLRADLDAIADGERAPTPTTRTLRAPAEGPGSVVVHHGDNLDVLARMDPDSIDAAVTDPPYGLGFMGLAWDRAGTPRQFAQWCQTWAEATLRVLKPGGHLVAFGGTRTHHRLMQGVEDAGFEIRDCGVWLYRTGFPKSHDVTGAMARYVAEGPAQLERHGRDLPPGIFEVTGFLRAARDAAGWSNRQIDALFGTNGMAGHWVSRGEQPAVPSPRQWEVLKRALGFGDEMDELAARLASTERPDDWGTAEDQRRFLDTLRTKGELDGTQGWGTALKPSIEPWVLARKPVTEGNVAANVLRWGTGALNIEGTRADMTEQERVDYEAMARSRYERHIRISPDGNKPADVYGVYGLVEPGDAPDGRWPANVVTGEDDDDLRFFRLAVGTVADYPKASAAEKPWTGEDGSAGQRATVCLDCGAGSYWRLKENICQRCGSANVEDQRGGDVDALHPTVKPVALMRHLVRLVTPPGGTVLDPFAGTGTTGEAAVLEGFDAVLIEREAEYLPLIRRRLGEDVEVQGVAS